MEFFIFFLFLNFFVFTVIQESTFIMIFLLISVFLLATGLLVLFSFEFLGYLLLIIYVGAVAVLFVFMVMLFDKSEYQVFRESAVKENRLLIFVSSYFLSIIIVFVLVVNFSFDFIAFSNSLKLIDFLHSNSIFNYLFPQPISFVNLSQVSDTHALGLVLYTNYFFAFILAGFGLLIAMIGAILITRNYYSRVEDKKKKKMQVAEKQLGRFSATQIKF